MLALEFGRRHGVPITTVMSKPPGRHGKPPKATVVPDVNAPEFLAQIGPGDHGIVTGFNQIFGQPAIDRFGSLANIHASVLPYYRGPTPAYWCIANGERATGYTLHEVTAKIDAGPILYQESFAIDGIRDPAMLGQRIAAAASTTFVRYLEHLRTGTQWEIRIVDASSVYATLVNYRSFPR